MKIRHSFALFLSFLIGTIAFPVHADDTKAPSPVAKIGNTVLNEDDMRKDMGMSLYDAENQLYQVKKNWVDQKAKTILFNQAAKDAGLSYAAWHEKEVDSKVTPPTQPEIDQMAQRMVQAGGTPTDAQKDQAKQYLLQQKRMQRENEVYLALAQKNSVELFFTKPEQPHIDITSPKDSPMKGPKDAPVTIVEFTDFQCPWCKKSQEEVKQVEEAYGKQIKLVDRMFPLTQIHPHAMPAAEAAMCAKEQGKYWEYRDKLFPSQTLSDDDFKQFAKDVGLNEKKFEACVSSHKYAMEIQNDIADGQRFGVRGTPTFYVDGLQTNFPQLMDTVKSELDKKKS